MSRRRLLQVGSLGLGGLSLSSLLNTQALGSGKVNPLTGKSVIFLFQQGGPSQFETFDPKPDAPSGIRTVGETISTSVPGVHFGGTMSQLAKLAHKFNVVRSFATKNGGHNIQPIVSSFSKEAAISTHFARIAGATRPDSGMPTTALWCFSCAPFTSGISPIARSATTKKNCRSCRRCICTRGTDL